MANNPEARGAAAAPAVRNLERERERLRRLGPPRAYAEVAAGRLRLAELAGPAGAYHAAEVAEHMKQGLAPASLLRPLLGVRQVRGQFLHFANQLSVDRWQPEEGPGSFLWTETHAVRYAEASMQRLLRLPSALLYQLAREDILSLEGIVSALDRNRLAQHVAEGSLRLPDDVLRGTAKPLMRCVQFNLMPAVPLQGAPRRWLEQAGRDWEQQMAQRGLGGGIMHDALVRTLRGLPPPPHRVVRLPLHRFEEVLNGVVDYNRVAEYLPPLSLAEMGRLEQQGHGNLNWADWFVRWPHDDETLRDALDFAMLQPYFVGLGGPNVARAVELLVARGQLPLDRAAAALAPTWRQGTMLPEVTVAWLRAERRLPQLLENVALPVPATAGTPLPPADQRRNAAYLALCIATFLERARPVPVEPAAAPEAAEPAEPDAEDGLANGRPGATASALARLGRLLGTVGPAPAQSVMPVGGTAPCPAVAAVVDVGETRACDACMDEQPVAALVDLEACAHGPRYDRACFLDYIDRNEVGSHTCPDPDCRRPFGLADAVQLALPFERRVAWAAHAARDALQREADWVGCRTVDCLGGRFELERDNVPLACTCCGVTAPPMRGQPVRYAQLDAAARAHVASLVRDAAVRLPPRNYDFELNNPDRNRPVRECFHCGIATQHMTACMHMTCRVESGGCGGHWDFVDGPHVWNQFELGPARYVPHTSWLVDLGLYDGLTPGQHGIDVVPVMRRNLARLQREAAAAER